MAVRCLHAWRRRRETHSRTPYPSAKPTIRAIAISTSAIVRSEPPPLVWIGDVSLLERYAELNMRAKHFVAVSPLGVVGGKPTREHRIQVRSQRSERLQFQASGPARQLLRPPRVPRSTPGAGRP